MSDPTTCTFDSFGGLEDPWPLFFSFAISSLLYGVFTTVFIMSIYTLLYKGLKSMSNKVVFTTIVIMYTVSTIHWIGLCILGWQELISKPPSPHLAGFVVMAIDFLPFVNFVLGDAIVVWRAWLVWDQRMLVFLIPGAVFMGGIATLAVYFVTSVRDLGRDGFGVFCILRSLSLAGLPVTYLLATTTNAYATSLVAVKAWRHRRSVKRHLGNGNRRTRVERLLVLLVESGSIYCAILAVATACIWANVGLAAVFIHPLLVQLTGIYPTIIIVLASLQKTHCDRNFTYETPVAFASPPRASRDAATFDLASAISTSGPRRPSTSDQSQMSAADVVIDVSREWKAEHTNDSLEPIAGVDVSRELHNA